MNPQNILITGTNRGLGLQLVKCFLKLDPPPHHVIATCRDPDNASELQALTKCHHILRIIQLDLLHTSDEILDTFVSKATDIVGSDGLNLVINNAATHTDTIDLDTLISTFTVNAFAPLLLGTKLMPLLKMATHNSTISGLSLSKAGIVNITSTGITNNKRGGYYPYRGSKAALNMFTKNLALEHHADGVLCVAMHPGHVKTDMVAEMTSTQTFGGLNWQTAEESAEALVQVMLACDGQHQGKCLLYTGEELPW